MWRGEWARVKNGERCWVWEEEWSSDIILILPKLSLMTLKGKFPQLEH